jgi:formylmethanofuran dehydrogenase subunit E
MKAYFAEHGGTRKGKKHTPEALAKMRAWQAVPEIKQKQRERVLGEKNHFYGKKHSEEMKKQISKTLMGHPVSEETRRKMSLKKMGKNPPNKGKKYTIVVCPHCKKQGAQPLMKRYHFDNCYKFGR